MTSLVVSTPEGRIVSLEPSICSSIDNGDSKKQAKQWILGGYSKTTAKLHLHRVVSRTTDDDSEGIPEPQPKGPEAVPYQKPFWQRSLFWIGAVCMVFAGATNPLLSKAAYHEESYPCASYETCEVEQFDGFFSLAIFKYFYQIILSSITFWGIDYGLLYKNQKRTIFSTKNDIEQSSRFPRKSYYKFLLTSALDCGFTLCTRAATMYTRASTVSMIGSLQIVTAVFADMIIVKRALTVGKTIGLMIILCGLLIYATGTTRIESSDAQDPNPALGAGLAVMSAIFRGVHSSLQGRNMRQYHFPPIKMVLIESSMALIYVFIICGFVQLGGLIDVRGEFYLVVRSSRIMMLINAFGFECFLFNGGAAIVGKFVSGLFRMIMARMTAFLMWSIEIMIGWTPFTLMTFIGWLILLSGVVVYVGRFYPGLSIKAPWFYRPLLCGSLIPPENSILSPKQFAQRQSSWVSVTIPRHPHDFDSSSTDDGGDESEGENTTDLWYLEQNPISGELINESHAPTDLLDIPQISICLPVSDPSREEGPSRNDP